MRLPREAGGGHLTYCSNIHHGETWPEVRAALAEHVPAVRAAVSAPAPFGIGLRLGAAAARELADPGARVELRGLLERIGSYVFTLNGFPYGPFHRTRVKQQVYAPDWGTPERLEYTNRLADILAAVLPPDVTGTVSTLPLTFKPWAEGRVEEMTRNLVRHVAHLVEIERASGRHLVLALEPEPCCYLETIAEAISFFREHLFGDVAAAELAGYSGLALEDARDALRRHAGLCYDVCHAAVEFEDPQASIGELRAAGVAIAKLQLSSALRVPAVTPAAARALRPFAEPAYLHQVVARHDGTVQRYADLPDALAEGEAATGAEWRIHFHVPVFRDKVVDFATTQPFLRQILLLHRQGPIAPHLEVETYTWGVLPEPDRNHSVSDDIARELLWVREQLGA